MPLAPLLTQLPGAAGRPGASVLGERLLGKLSEVSDATSPLLTQLSEVSDGASPLLGKLSGVSDGDTPLLTQLSDG